MLSPRARFALAALSGALVFVSFPGVGAWPVAFIAWVPLLLALEGVPVRRAIALGFVAGLTSTLPAFRFLYATLLEQSGLGPVPCALILLLVAAYHGLRGALIGGVSRSIPNDTGPPSLLFLAGLALSEIAIPSLFPWYFGASVHDVPLFTQTAELAGPVAVSVVLALSSVAVAETISSWWPDRQTKPRVIVPTLAIPILAALWGSLRIAQIDARAESAPPLAAGVVQPQLTNEVDETETERRLRDSTQTLVSKGAELVIWPEGALPYTLPRPLVQDTLGLLKLPRVTLLTGALVQGEGPPPALQDATNPDSARYDSATSDAPSDRATRRVTNSALLFDAGRWVGRYDKVRLLPFSEYLPFEATFPTLRSLSPHSGRFAAGTTLSPMRFDGHAIATFICYEDLFPSHVRALTAPDVDLLVNVTNDSWFHGDEPAMHLALAQLRAVEQRKYLLRSTVTGVSAIIDPVGRALATLPEGRQDTLFANIHWMRGRTLYQLTGDVPWWLFVATALVIAQVRRRRSLGRLATT